MRLFVTGATGFIGRAFCEAATSAGHRILGLSRKDRPPGATLPNAVLPAPGSLEDLPWREIEAFAPDAAVHLAWVATPGVYLHSAENQVFADQSALMFQGLADRGVRHLVGTGTCIEYAPSDAPLNEDQSPLGPQYPYSRAKVATAQNLRELALTKGIGWAWMRVFYPYGEGEHPDRLPSLLFRRLAAGETVELKAPNSIKDYVHISDAAAGMLAVVERGLTGYVNIGSGTGTRIRDLAYQIAELVGAPPDRVADAEQPPVDPFPVTIADVTRLQSASWAPKQSLRSGLERLWSALLRDRALSD